jgi:single-stranded-DNA-specific exonuclease
MLPSNYQWLIKHADEKQVSRLSQQTGLPSMITRLLILRGINDAKQAKRFLHPEKLSFHDPLLMRGMRTAMARLRRAADGHESVRIFGDYDADGVTSTALLARTLKKIGIDVSCFIPNRFRDGYGPNARAVDQAAHDGIGLIVTVDSGIAAFEAADRAAELGIDYIVTDHHQPPPRLPQALAVLNPKQPGCSYPFKELSGAGVALKLAQAVCSSDQFAKEWIALAAVGTIADLVSLRDENRLIAAKGLELIEQGSLPGLDALRDQAGMHGKIDSEAVGFQLAPRLNAAGRLADATPALQLLLSDDSRVSATLAAQLDELNRKRKALVDRIAKEADRQASAFFQRGDKAFVLAGPRWHQGVIGIAASKIVADYHRPTIILSIDPDKGTAKGSGRSIEGFDLYRALSACGDFLTQFGGHKMAAGLSLPETEIDGFREAFVRYAGKRLTGEALVPKLPVEGSFDPDTLAVDQIDQLSLLEPFGTGNPRPLFLIDGAAPVRIKAVGRDGAHLKMSLKGNRKAIDGIGFGFGNLCLRIAETDRVSVVGECTINEWNGFRRPQLMIEDLKVGGLQLFDWRSEQNLQSRLEGINQSAAVLAFREETVERLHLRISPLRYRPGLTVARPGIVFLDLPDHVAQLTDVLSSNPKIHRIYAVFDHHDEHYFTPFPARGDFAWYYAVIHREKTMNLKKMVAQIARFKGWTERMIYFMTKVFFELGFVKIKNGFLRGVTAPEKAPLSNSPTYRQEKNQLKLEEFFCYGPAASLKAWFSKIMHNRAQTTEPEEKTNGLHEVHHIDHEFSNQGD